MSETGKLRWWIIAATVWPLLMLTLCFAWPGPEKQPQLQNYFERPAYDAASPPVDTKGAKGELSVSDAQGSAHIFWSQPDKGKVQLKIEIPKKDR